MGFFSKLSLSSSSASRSNHVEEAVTTTVREQVSFEGLDDLILLQTLGTGTFGRVRLVQHKKTGKFMALKCMKKYEIIRTKQVEHVLSEKAILMEIQHPFVIQLYSTYQDETKLYMLMEYAPGGEIFTHLRRAGRFPTQTVRCYIWCITLALEHMHAKDIAYRDLKPENLLLDRNGVLKITDFGFAKRIADRTWTLCGTPEYLAPEIIQSKGHGKSVDWWALGVLMYEMIAGYPPFYDENPFKIYQKILVGKFELPRHFDPDCKDLVRKLLEADRTKRYGALRNGAEDIKRHKFFSGYNFSGLLQGTVKFPIIPLVTGEGDTKNFDQYPESAENAKNPPELDAETNYKLFNSF